MSIETKRTELKPEFLGVAGVNSFAPFCSSPRMVMDFSHISSRVSLVNPDTKFLLTGVERELGKYINDVRTEHDLIIKARIPKRMDLGELNPETLLLVEYERNGELWLDMIEIPNHKSTHGFFGYSLTPTEELENIHFNSAVARDTVLAKTDSLADDGNYMFGVNANVAMMSHPSVAEDGFVVSESFLDKMKFTSVTKRVIYLTKDNLPINLYGDENKFKMIPDIGEPVRPDGLLCGIRDRNDWFSVADLNNEGISEIDQTFDTPIYVPKDSIVIDVNVVRGNYQKSEYVEAMTEQLDEYAETHIRYCSNIVKMYNDILKEHRNKYGPDFKARQSPRLRRFVTDCMIMVDSVNSRNKLCHRRVNIDQYRVEVTCMSVIRPNLGFKLTDIHAAKGVICRVLPDSMMPVDSLGNRADVITDPSSTISRMNLGRAYEHYMGALTRDNRLRLKGILNGMGAEELTSLDIDKGIQFLRGLYSYINSDMIEFIDSLDEEGKRQHLHRCLTDDMYLYYPPDNENNIVDVISALEKSDYKPHLGKVNYIDELGKEVTTIDDVRIGRMYIMVLDKIANNYSAVSSAKVNSFNFPIKGGGMDRYKYPHSLTPTTTLSETEVRIFSSFADPSLIGELIDLALNPVSHKLLIRNILEKEEPFSTDFDIDRSVDDYGQTKSLMLLKHIFNASGFDLKYEETKKIE